MSPIVSIAIVVAYVLVMLAVGWFSMRKTRDVKDFFIGGRTLGPWMSAFAFGTTYFSAVLFIGYAGKLGWGFGIHTMWIVLGNTVVGTVLAWKVLAGRTRDMTARLSAITMPEFLRARFGSTGLQVFAAVVVFVFLVPYSASVLMGLSYLFEMTLHIPYETALYFLTALTAVYLVMGGYFAVAISDFIRGIVEFAGVMLMVWLLAHRPETGGFVQATGALLANPEVNAPGLLSMKPIGVGGLAIPLPGWVTLAALVLITSFGPWALPQMVQKFYSIRSRNDVRRAMVIAGVFALFMSFGAYYSGALSHLFYGAKLPADLIGPKGPIFDKIMPHFITTSGLPAALILVVVLMVFSASMSSLSSLVLVSSSAVAIDIYGAFGEHAKNPRDGYHGWGIFLAFLALVELGLGIAFFRFPLAAMLMLGLGAFCLAAAIALFAGARDPGWWMKLTALLIGILQFPILTPFAVSMWRYASRKEKGLPVVERGSTMVLMRILCVIFVGFSLFVALAKPTFIVNLMVMSWGTLSGVFLAPYLYGLFWRGTTRAGVWAGMLAGLATAVLLFWAWGADGVPLAGAIAMLLPLIVVPIVSRMTRAPAADAVAKAFGDEEPPAPRLSASA